MYETFLFPNGLSAAISSLGAHPKGRRQIPSSRKEECFIDFVVRVSQCLASLGLLDPL